MSNEVLLAKNQLKSHLSCVLENYACLRDEFRKKFLERKPRIDSTLELFRRIFILKNLLNFEQLFNEKFENLVKETVSCGNGQGNGLVRQIETSMTSYWYTILREQDGHSTSVKLFSCFPLLILSEKDLCWLLQGGEKIILTLVKEHKISAGTHLPSCDICLHEKNLMCVLESSSKPVQEYGDDKVSDVLESLDDNATKSLVSYDSESSSKEPRDIGEARQPESHPRTERTESKVLECSDDVESRAKATENQQSGDIGEVRQPHPESHPSTEGTESKYPAPVQCISRDLLGQESDENAESTKQPSEVEDESSKSNGNKFTNLKDGDDKQNVARTEFGIGKKIHHNGEQPKITEETLINALTEVESEIEKLENDKLRELFEELRRKVEVVVRNQQDEIQNQKENLQREIQQLKIKVENLKVENEKIVGKLALAQATRECEAHLARFVVDPQIEIDKEDCLSQMRRHVKKTRHNRLRKIDQRLGIKWSDEHWRLVNSARRERNSIAHPRAIDFELVAKEIARMPQECQEPMKDILHRLKMTASLMKFGRLAATFEFPRAELRNFGENALRVMISWDREFEQINGLQNIAHEEGKKYLEKYVTDRTMKAQCLKIVDYIKNENSKRLGKLASKRPTGSRPSEEHYEALVQLRQLLPNQDEEGNVKELDKTIAKLHIPDVLPKRLWKHGIEIVEKHL